MGSKERNVMGRNAVLIFRRDWGRSEMKRREWLRYRTMQRKSNQEMELKARG